MNWFLPTRPSTQARRISRVLGALLTVAAYILVLVLLLALWSVAGLVIVASVGWDLTAGLALTAVARVIRRVRAGK